MCKDNPNGMTLDRVEIHSVSTRIKLIDYEPRGSIFGGTLIFIKAKGHSTTSSNNSIKVGPVKTILFCFFYYFNKYKTNKCQEFNNN